MGQCTQNWTKLSEFNESTNNYLQKKKEKKKDIHKNNRPNLFSEHDILPYRKSVVIKGQLWWSDMKTTVFFLPFCLQFQLYFEEI